MKISSSAKLIIILAIAFLLIVPGYIIYGFLGRSRLLDHHAIAAGRITGCRQGIKGSPGACNIHYSYSVDGRQYTGTTLFKPSELDYDTCLEFLSAHFLPIVYETGNADNSVLLLTPREAGLYSYSYPDSLKWVTQYVHEQ